MSRNVDLLELARTVVGPGPDVAGTIQSTPRQLPSSLKTLTTLGLLVGVAALAGGLMTHTDRTLGVVLTCIFYFICVAQGGVMFAVAQHASFGRWGRPFKRIAESFAVTLPIFYLLWIVFLLAGGMTIYPWTHETMHGHKAIWLQPGFFVGRQVVLLGILFLLSLMFLRNSLRPDLGVAAETLGTRAPAWWGRITTGWKGREAEVEESYQRNVTLSIVLIIVYFLTFSLFAVDAVMSLEPHWYANMFPGWIAASSFWVSMSWICLFAVIGGKWLQIDHLTKRNNFLDLGKLMFAMCIFWAYTTFAQFLPIWYGNMPEETGYLMLRTYTDTWGPLAKVVLGLCFILPFTVLLSRGIKKLPRSLAAVAAVIAFGVFLERFLLVMPAVWSEPSLPIGPIELGVLLGFLSLFVRVVTMFLAQVPGVSETDPFMNPNPSDVHLHARSHGPHPHDPKAGPAHA